MIRRFSMFWGCTIPARFPFIEKSTRLALDLLDAEVVDTDGFTCCPEGTLVKAVSEEAYYVTAGRNLAVAEATSLPMVTPCNGCYSTFKSTQAEFKSDWRKRAGLNDLLAEEGLSYDGSLVVKHFMEWIHEDIGPAAVAKKVVKPLGGMRIAVHYGCHMLRPSPAVRWDSAGNPTKFEDMVRALGATVVEYETKLDCCGGALDRVGQRDEALQMCRNKLLDLKSEAVDALVVCCPSCFQQFDLNQATLLRQKEDLEMPVLYYTELLCLALGRQPEELGLSMHRVPTDAFMERWARKTEQRRAIAQEFSLAELQKCNDCKACETDCPVAKLHGSFSPTTIIGEILSGDLDGVIERGDLWKCLDCFTCYEKCHSRLGMAEVFRKLKELATNQGQLPDAVRFSWDMFAATGVLGEPRESARLKLGLRPSPESGGAELKRILERMQGADANACLDAEVGTNADAAGVTVRAAAAPGDASTPGGTI
jgi:heterodisulfide reductase subunit B